MKLRESGMLLDKQGIPKPLPCSSAVGRHWHLGGTRDVIADFT